jgi:DNA recombination protein RmuC
MDVKFPLDNYVRYLEAERDPDRESLKSQFLKDVKSRIKEVTTRDYINPEENTLDYVLVFIPNEQVYAFINENDPSLIDEALRNKVILCSPFTLYAILAIIRQAMDNFNLEETAGSMLKLMGTFRKQWELFVKSMEKMGKKLEEAQSEYQGLTATRRNQLERPLRQIEELRQQKGLEAEPLTIEAEVIPVEAEAVDGSKDIDENP